MILRTRAGRVSAPGIGTTQRSADHELLPDVAAAVRVSGSLYAAEPASGVDFAAQPQADRGYERLGVHHVVCVEQAMSPASGRLGMCGRRRRPLVGQGRSGPRRRFHKITVPRTRAKRGRQGKTLHNHLVRMLVELTITG